MPRDVKSLGQHMLELSCENETVGTNGLNGPILFIERSEELEWASFLEAFGFIFFAVMEKLSWRCDVVKKRRLFRIQLNIFFVFSLLFIPLFAFPAEQYPDHIYY